VGSLILRHAHCPPEVGFFRFMSRSRQALKMGLQIYSQYGFTDL